MSVVKLRGLVRTFKDVTAVDRLDLTLEAGRIYGLLGPNGSGKTTTLRLLMGLALPDRGEVEVFGGPPNDEARARIGYVPETRALVDSARVRELLVFYARMRGMSADVAKKAADDWIDRLALEDKADEVIKTLSNGQQQKVQIALALVSEPDLILLDEPLTGLDPTHQDMVSEHLGRAARAGATVVLSTHRLREAEVFIEHVVMLARGRSVLDKALGTALREAFDGRWEVRVDPSADASWIDGPDVVAKQTRGGGVYEVRLAHREQPHALLGRASSAGEGLLGVRAILPDLHDLYRSTVGTAIDAAGEVLA